MLSVLLSGMASVFRREGTKFFHADFRDAKGIRRHRSTKVTNRKEAEKIAAKYEEAAQKRRTFAQVKQVISDLHEEITGETLKRSACGISSTIGSKKRRLKQSLPPWIFIALPPPALPIS